MKKKPIHKPKHIIRELKKAALKDLEPMKYEAFAYLSKPYFQDAEGKFHDTWEIKTKTILCKSATRFYF
jgi:hypothetical protein